MDAVLVVEGGQATGFQETCVLKGCEMTDGSLGWAKSEAAE